MKIQKIVSDITNSNFVRNHIRKSSLNSKFLARTLLITSVSKDVFAYGLRVFNTLRNDSIPQDKKNYTAKMDAASGIATAISQIGAGFLVSSEKFQDFFSEKLFSKLKGKDLKNAKTAFGALSTLILASVFAKRIVTPYIACKMSGDKNKA